MEIDNKLSAQIFSVSPLDGRYQNKLSDLQNLVGEGALIQNRIYVELSWLKHLAELCFKGEIDLPWKPTKEDLHRIDKAFNLDHKSSLLKIKEIENKCNHDVKSVEYYLQDILRKEGADDKMLAMIHFACTSDDINNLAYSLMLKQSTETCVIPAMKKVLKNLANKALEYKSSAMISRTHGQSASPTTMGKELAVFASRMQTVLKKIERHTFDGKFNGAVGNYNAHFAVCPSADWQAISKDFVVNKMGLSWNKYTTQIENHDAVAHWCSLLNQYQTIGLDLVRDLWTYISMGYFSQRKVDDEVGSSTMPHKINPIDFENAEGNFGLSISLGEHFARKLPISRLQRDLSDSTVMRSIGSMLGYLSLAQSSLQKGLSKISLNEEKMAKELSQSIELLAEPVQTVMRSFGILDAYERLKKISRGKEIKLEDIHSAIDACEELPDDVKKNLKNLRSNDYLGCAEKLAEECAEKLIRKY